MGLLSAIILENEGFSLNDLDLMQRVALKKAYTGKLNPDRVSEKEEEILNTLVDFGLMDIGYELTEDGLRAAKVLDQYSKSERENLTLAKQLASAEKYDINDDDYVDDDDIIFTESEKAAMEVAGLNERQLKRILKSKPLTEFRRPGQDKKCKCGGYISKWSMHEKCIRCRMKDRRESKKKIAETYYPGEPGYDRMHLEPHFSNYFEKSPTISKYVNFDTITDSQLGDLYDFIWDRIDHEKIGEVEGGYGDDGSKTAFVPNTQYLESALEKLLTTYSKAMKNSTNESENIKKIKMLKENFQKRITDMSDEDVRSTYFSLRHEWDEVSKSHIKSHMSETQKWMNSLFYEFEIEMDKRDMEHYNTPDEEYDEPEDQFMNDAEADADALASAGYGSDEDYGMYDSGDGDWFESVDWDLKLKKRLNETSKRNLTTKDVAEKVARDLEKRYGYYTSDKPVVREIENGHSVSWGGPQSWATNDTYWFHEELAPMMQEFRADTKYNPEDYKPYYDEVPGFYMEPISGMELGIYKD